MVVNNKGGNNMSKRFGWHAGKLTCETLEILGSLTFGDASADTLTVTGISAFGTNSSKITLDTAGTKFISVYTDCGAASDDSRGIYVAHSITGTGSGEAIRGRTVVSAAGAGKDGTVNGGHFGVEFTGSGTIAGLATGARMTFMSPNDASLAGAGTLAGGMSELWSEGSSTDWSGTFMHSIHRFVMGGNATGADTATNVFEFDGLGTSTQFVAATNAVIDHGLQCYVNGTKYWIGLYDATSG